MVGSFFTDFQIPEITLRGSGDATNFPGLGAMHLYSILHVVCLREGHSPCVLPSTAKPGPCCQQPLPDVPLDNWETLGTPGKIYTSTSPGDCQQVLVSKIQAWLIFVMQMELEKLLQVALTSQGTSASLLCASLNVSIGPLYLTAGNK